MRMKKYVLGAFALVALLAACKNEEHEKEIGEINALRVKLVKTDSLLKNVDGDLAERISTEMKNNTQFIQFNIDKIGDTIDFKTAMLLNNYRSMLPSFNAIAENHEHIEKAIDSANVSLANLEHDIRNNTLAKPLTPESAIEQEEEQVNEMYEYAGSMRSTLDKVKAGYDTLAPKIDEYMKTLTQRLAEKMAAPKK